MADVHNALTRSKNMRAISNSGTVIEKKVAELLTDLDISYRVQVKDLIGRPDFVLDDYQAVIFVNGCFWHGHNCHLFKTPNTNTAFWLKKINRNINRDNEVFRELAKQHWKILLIWECALKGVLRKPLSDVSERVEEWLCASSTHGAIDSSGIHSFDII